jgi:NAD(P)-dependent dehydrogenase (short-subunit alcohol dehydrogenase family)
MAQDGTPTKWLITGAGTGLGRALAAAALRRGDLVAALVRKQAARDSLMAMAPGRCFAIAADVTDAAGVAEAVQAAQRDMGGIDVLVNNAGQVLETTVEEADAAQIRALFDVNFQGPINLIQAVLPGMRARGAGRIINIGSGGGMVGLPAIGIYCASKFALEGLSEALAAELAPLGIKVTIVEPGSFRTNLLIGSTVKIPTRIEDYEQSCGAWRRTLGAMAGREPNDPARGAQALLMLADAAHPPLRLPLGKDAFAMVDGKLAQVRRDIEPWRDIGKEMEFSDAAWYAAPPGQSQIS